VQRFRKGGMTGKINGILCGFVVKKHLFKKKANEQ
jgi:hypothetical protein